MELGRLGTHVVDERIHVAGGGSEVGQRIQAMLERDPDQAGCSDQFPVGAIHPPLRGGHLRRQGTTMDEDHRRPAVTRSQSRGDIDVHGQLQVAHDAVGQVAADNHAVHAVHLEDDSPTQDVGRRGRLRRTSLLRERAAEGQAGEQGHSEPFHVSLLVGLVAWSSEIQASIAGSARCIRVGRSRITSTDSERRFRPGRRSAG